MLQSIADPYKTIFHVREELRPPTAYAMLLLDQFEADRDKIKRAISRAQYRLDSHRDSLDEATFDKLQDELTAAQETLLQHDRKALLDASLRRRSKNHVEPPEKATTTTHECVDCGVENSSDSQFCRGCGATQWSRCAACKTTCHQSQAFCGECGVNLQEARRQANSELARELERGVAAAKDYDLDQAVSMLRPVALVEDPEFDAVCSKALQWIAKIDRLREASAAASESLAARAEKLIEQRKYSAAIRAIESHTYKRNDTQLHTLKTTAEKRRDELEQLRREIATAIKSKKLRGLSSRLERLNDLAPDAGETNKLEQQLAARFLQQAKQSIDSRQYDAALRWLDEIPKRCRSQAVLAIEDTAREFACLSDQLNQAVAITQPLREFAKKLADASDPDQSIARLAKKIMSAENAPAHPHDAFATVRRKQAGNRWPAPIHWLGRCKLRQSEAAAEKMSEFSGVWYSAMGLALQGLGEAAVPLNLLPKKGLLRGWLGAGSRAKAAWGVDLGNDAIKAVRMTRGSDQSIQFENAIHVRHDEPLNRAGSAEDPRQLVQASIDKLSDAIDSDTPIILGLPASRVLARFVRLPQTNSRKTDDAMKYEAQHRFPLSLEDLHWTFHIFDQEAEAEPQRNAVLLAARQSAAAEILEPMRAKKWQVAALQSSTVGLHNYLAFDYFDNRSSAPKKPVVVVDLGAAMGSLLVCSPNRFWQVGLSVAGIHFTNAITATHGLTFQQAEELKRKPWLAKRIYRLLESWAPINQQFESELQRSLNAYENQFPDPSFSAILGVGGAFAQHGLFDHLQRSK